MVASQKVLVIEDHEQLNAMMCRILQKAHFDAQGVLSAEEVSECPGLHNVEFFIVDWNLPGEDGASLITRLRKGFPSAGIILLTARSGATNQIKGYSSGADLFLSKPVKEEELIDALKALGSRKDRQPFSAQPMHEASVVLSRTHLQLKANKQSISLSLLEVKLLTAFIAAPQCMLEVWQLTEIMSTNGYAESSRALEVQISRLRKKLSSITFHPNPISHIKGYGYGLLCNIEIR